VPGACTATGAGARGSGRIRLAFWPTVEFSRGGGERGEAVIGTFNEMFDGGAVRPAYAQLVPWVESTSPEALALKKAEAEALFRRIGITFAVYGEGGDTERLIPFDMMPRVFTEGEWRKLEKGVKQRARALNAFLWDVYHRAEIVRAGVIPADLVFRNEAYEPAVVGIDPPGRVYSHIVGIDLVRTGPEDFFVLEDNCRTPSGVSYMLENREVMMRLFPDLFAAHPVLPIALPGGASRHAPSGGAVALPGRAHGRRADPRRVQFRLLSIAFSPTRWASTWSRAQT
jgi:uncharacterized circularly permuted ATP-grasp superfamily protein